VIDFPEFIQGRESYRDSATKKEVKDLAEKFANEFNNMGFSATVEHSGSKAGVSSYIKVYDPQTGRYLAKPIRISDHSKGVKESQSVIEVLNPLKDFKKIVNLLQEMRKTGESLVVKQDRYAQQLIADGFKPKQAYKKARLEMFDRQENPTMTKRKFSPAQLAAQKLFAERARSGTLKKGKRKANPKKKTVSSKISQLVHEGYPQKQAVAVALSEQRAGKVKRNSDKAKPRAYVRRASQATGAPPSKRLMTRRKMALTAPAGYFPNPKMSGMVTGYQVICMHPKKHVVGIFKTMAEAKQIATAMANAKGVAYAVKTIKVHKAHFAV
jgi:hypothetical protein